MKLAELEGVRAKPTSHMGQDTNVQINIMGLSPKYFWEIVLLGGFMVGWTHRFYFLGRPCDEISTGFGWAIGSDPANFYFLPMQYL